MLLRFWQGRAFSAMPITILQQLSQWNDKVVEKFLRVTGYLPRTLVGNTPKLKAAFVFYGSGPVGKDDLARIKLTRPTRKRDEAWVRWKSILGKI
jgi:hypothetical protein